jgi:hypothetical protein
MRAAVLFAILLVTPVAGPTSAACQGDETFSCTIGGKTLQVCYWKGALVYAYGRTDKPELTIAEPLETVAYTPWPGIGRAIWDSVAFQNEGITYEVWTSFDRIDESAILEGGVNVLEGDTTLATLTCDRGSVQRGLETIGELKSGIGQCWDMDSRTWGLCN